MASKQTNKNIMREEEAIRIFYDFATGAIDTPAFWSMYQSDESLRNALIYDRKREKGAFRYDPETSEIVYHGDVYTDTGFTHNPDNLLETINIDRLQDRYALFEVVNRYLLGRKIIVGDCDLNSDAEEYLFLESMLPYWVGVKDISYLQDLFATAPSELSRRQKLIWCREKIDELFRCDEAKPEWIQEPQWPMTDNRPLTFRRQETTASGLERYYFYDSETGKEVVVEQY